MLNYQKSTNLWGDILIYNDYKLITFVDFPILMNFLAHSHLSGNNEDVMFGNFIADSIKGNSYNNFRRDIATGILLHREIDSFTDNHEITKHSKKIVRENFGKFSGVVVDIYYDHFLARNWGNYSNIELSKFSSHVYQILAMRFFLLPLRIKKLLPFLIGQNWLSGYASKNDLARVFKGMDRRTNYISGMEDAMIVLEKNYEELYMDFVDFYVDLEAFSAKALDKLTAV